MKKFKFIIQLIVFLIIFIVIFDKLTLLFVRKGNGFGTDVLNFYKQEEDSIDILYLGSSHAYSSFNPYLIEELTGLNGYVFSTQQQPIGITYFYLKEALKYQKPKYVVLEVHMAVVGSNEYAEEQVNRDAIDKMKMSLNKVEAINSNVEKENRMSYYFNIIKYHSRYKSLDKIDFKTVLFDYTVDNKGYIALSNTGYIFDNKKIRINNNTNKIFAKNEIYLNKIIKLCKENDIELVFVKTPALYDNAEYSKLNYIIDIAKDNNILFVNYISDMDNLKLDFKEDFYDGSHLTGKGSDKLSLNFSNYLL